MSDTAGKWRPINDDDNGYGIARTNEDLVPSERTDLPEIINSGQHQLP